MDDPATDEEETEPRFILFGPAVIAAGPDFPEALQAVLGALRPAAFVLRNGSIGGAFDRLSSIKNATRDHGLALLSEDDFSAEIDGDGYHLTDPSKVEVSRFGLSRDLGSGANGSDHYLFGADAGLSRHDAMVAGEGGADYVVFGDRDRSPDPEVFALIRWWRALTVVQCLGHAAAPGDVAGLVDAGADFIGVGTSIWNHPDGPAAAANEMAAALEIS